MEAVYKKDLQSAFRGMTGWVLCAFMTGAIGLYFTALCLSGGYAEFGYVLNSIMFIFLVAVPLLTMRSVVEERRQKTDQLLLTSPASIGSIVWGKYLALVTVFAVPVLLAAVLPIIMAQFGTVSLARAYLSLGAFFLMGAAAIAIGLFLSSMTESQIIAAVCTFGALLVIYLLPSIAQLLSATALTSALGYTLLAGALALAFYTMVRSAMLCGALFVAAECAVWGVYIFNSTALEGSIQKLMNAAALFDRFTPFVNGVCDVKALVYFASVALLFVFLTCQSFEKRRWS